MILKLESENLIGKLASFGVITMPKLGFFIILLIALTSCGGDEESDDIERPEIKVLSTSPELSSGIVCEAPSDIILLINTGESVEVSVQISDDVALGSLKFDLHHNFDCHGHKSSAKNTVWSLIEIVELSGTSQVVTRSFQSPEDVRPGNYHLGMMALDEMGREAAMTFFDLVIRDPADTDAPDILLTAPEEGSIHQRGIPLEISGIISDDSSMDTGGYEIIFVTPQGTELSVARGDFAEGTGSSVDFSESYSIPSFVDAGTSTIIIKATDWRNNETTLERAFELVD